MEKFLPTDLLRAVRMSMQIRHKAAKNDHFDPAHFILWLKKSIVILVIAEKNTDRKSPIQYMVLTSTDEVGPHEIHCI